MNQVFFSGMDTTKAQIARKWESLASQGLAVPPSVCRRPTRKLEAGGEPRLLHAVRGWGYVLRP
jgi:hypothetical protein